MKRRSTSKSTDSLLAASLWQGMAVGDDHSGPSPSGSAFGWAIPLALALIALVALAAYRNSFAAPFILDDQPGIVRNPDVQHLWPIWDVLFPSSATTLGGRPVVSLTLALNLALGGTDVWGYHALNLAIHILAAWALLGVVRRTLLLPRLRELFGPAATPLALVVALLWMIHPLQTEAVTCVIQRAEALMGLFYLLTLYCVIRGATSRWSSLWYVAATVACLLGMATKEVMATAPVIVLLYDRTFLAGSFREAWRRRYGLYLALAATWGVVAALLFSTGFHGDTTGLAAQDFTWWSYLLTQTGVITHYLRLALWPSGLCLDYGWPAAQTASEIVAPAILMAGLLGLTVWALVKRPAWGFLGAWFFVILAPTSSFVPIQDAACEHRMYLPLAALVTGAVLGGWTVGQWLVFRGTIRWSELPVIGGSLAMLATLALGILTFERNAVYQSDLSIWEDTAAKAPGNERAHNCLGMALGELGQTDDAMVHYRQALEINPDYADAHNNLADALAKLEQLDEALVHYQRALELNPDRAETHNNLGVALAHRGRIDEAVVQYREALRIKPDLADAHDNLGFALAHAGDLDGAIAHFTKALEIEPSNGKAREHFDVASAQREAIIRALAERRELLRRRPNDVNLLNEVAWVFATSPNTSIRNGAEALDLVQRAVQLSGGREPAILGTLAAAYAEAGQFSEAVRAAEQALALASSQNNTALAAALRSRVKLYQAGSPYRDVPQSEHP